MTRQRILLLLLPAALLCACAPSRRTAAVHSRAENDLRMQALREELSTRDSLFFRALYEELRRSLDGERQLHRVVGEEVETLTREYDTSRPVDTLTGTPPLWRETTRRRRLTDSIREAGRVRQTERQVRSDTLLGGGHTGQQLRTEGNTSRQEVGETDLTTAQRRGLTWWQHALCIAGLLAVAYGSCRLFKHRLKQQSNGKKQSYRKSLRPDRGRAHAGRERIARSPDGS